MRFSVITPCYQSGPLLEETIRSVLEQTAVTSGRVQLEYLVCDGGSTDGTREIVERLASPHLQFFSEPDRGMYDALRKGLQRGTGEIVSYLNAGDYYHKTALDVVADVFENYPDVSWLTGFNAFYNERSHLIGIDLPYRYRSQFFFNGLHGRVLPTLQQESTFWRADLHRLLDYDRLASLRLAGDYYLWMQFAREHRPAIVSAHLGGFKFHHGQQTRERGEYMREFYSLVAQPSLRDYPLVWLDWLAWKLATPGIKRRLNPAGHFVYDAAVERWRRYRD